MHNAAEDQSLLLAHDEDYSHMAIGSQDWEFDRATAVLGRDNSPVEPTNLDVYAARIDAGWTVMGKPNGGYLLAVIAQACRAALARAGSSHRDPIVATAHFLRVPEVGPATVTCSVLRIGKNACQIHAALCQGGAVCVDATFTIGTLHASTEPPYFSARTLFEVAPYSDCLRVPAQREGSPFVVSIMDRSDLRLDPAVMGFVHGRPSGDAELRGWISFADGRAVDSLGLLYFCDALPPATFELVQSGWVPTLSLTVYVRALPESGPLRIRQVAHAIDGGRVDETCEVWDASGRLVAQATQLAGIRI